LLKNNYVCNIIKLKIGLHMKRGKNEKVF